MNDKDNKTYLEAELRKTLSHCPDVTTEPEDALKKFIAERRPMVYIIQCGGSFGDRLPVLNIAKWLMKNLDCDFHLWVGWHRVECLSVLAASGLPVGRFTVHQWLKDMLEKHPKPDVVYTNQVMRMEYDPMWQEESLLLRNMLDASDALWIEVEHQWLVNGFIQPNNTHFRQLRARQETLAEWRVWRKSAKINKAEAANQAKTIPRVKIEAFPSELLTEEELKNSDGIFGGWVPPLNITAVRPSAEAAARNLGRFIVASRLAQKKIIYIGRGGTTMADWGVRAALLTLFEAHTDWVFVAFNNLKGRENVGDRMTKLVVSDLPEVNHPRIHWVNFGEIYMPDWFRFFDVAVHHGGCGTVMMGLSSAVPAIVIPDDVADQLQNGIKLEDIGCGIALQPRVAKDRQYTDIVAAVEKVMNPEEYQRFKRNCEKWRGILAKVRQCLPCRFRERLFDCGVDTPRTTAWR
ncbi:hypothetical protein HGRIS_007458 [Hohenbuehelia grisea]|uniref:Erythromycin biosynthesis protein CIII-like C-terminal domain-containing protein n=1 Tax=Hohenbuehelia grisea TaxID=104357 RepID=A0ABR3J4V4_9AGAR